MTTVRTVKNVFLKTDADSYNWIEADGSFYFFLQNLTLGNLKMPQRNLETIQCTL